mgnify:CR=1 FL=1
MAATRKKKGDTSNGTTMLGADGQTLIRLTRLEVVMEGVRDDLTELKDDISDLRSELLKEMRASRVARTETVKLFLEPKVFVPVLVLAGLFIAAATGVGVSWGDLEVRGAEAAPIHLDHHDTHTSSKKERKDGKHSRRNNP